MTARARASRRRRNPVHEAARASADGWPAPRRGPIVPAMDAELPHVLIVDDDTRLRELLRRFLMENDFRVTTAPDARAAQAHTESLAFDLIVLDVMMPGQSGLELTDRLRRANDVPILLLTAMAEPEDRIAGLERGADDYLTKPFEPRELVARIRSILRRAPLARERRQIRINLGDHSYDLEREELSGPGGPVRLTSAETRLLRALAARPGIAISREGADPGEPARRQCPRRRRPGHPPAPQNRGRSQAAALSADRARRGLRAPPRLGSIVVGVWDDPHPSTGSPSTGSASTGSPGPVARFHDRQHEPVFGSPAERTPCRSWRADHRGGRHVRGTYGQPQKAVSRTF